MLDEISEKRDFLLDSEKDKIESKIIETINEEHNKQEQSEKFVQEKNKLTKNRLVEEFMALQKTQLKEGQEPEFPEVVVKRMTKNEIIKKIANFADKKVQEGFAASIPTQIPEGALDDIMSMGLYNMNICIVKVLEAAGHTFKHKTNDVNILENFAKEVEERREAFLLVFRQIYRDHREEVNKYMSPLTQYFLLTSQCAATTIHKNIAKKKEDI